MTKLKTDDMTSKDTLQTLIEKNGGTVNVSHRSTGKGKQGEWTLSVQWQDTLDGLTFLKALRHYDTPADEDRIRYEVA